MTRHDENTAFSSSEEFGFLERTEALIQKAAGQSFLFFEERHDKGVVSPQMSM